MVGECCACHSVHTLSFTLTPMNVLSRAMLLVVISPVAVFCQTAASQDEHFLGTRFSVAPTHISQPIALVSSLHDTASITAVSWGIEPFTYHSYKDGGYASLSPLHFRSESPVRSALATSRISTRFNYTTSNAGLKYFPIKLGPVRYTFSLRVSDLNRPAAAKFQNVIDGVLRHYTWRAVVVMNDRCVRSLSCTSLYEQALRRRAVQSGY